MVEKGLKLPQTDQNGPKRTKMEDPFGAKWFKMAQKWTKMAQNGPKWSKKGPNCPKWTKMAPKKDQNKS